MKLATEAINKPLLPFVVPLGFSQTLACQGNIIVHRSLFQSVTSFPPSAPVNMRFYFSAPNPLSIPQYRADADRAAPHTNPDCHVRGLQERHA